MEIEECGHDNPIMKRTFQVGENQVVRTLCKICAQEPEFLEYVIRQQRFRKKAWGFDSG